ncbi:hypothetical protein P153DRAFT_391346 [Dothidotthia symphoricarpi CBS 119687]|uniref:Uncharacterized protein n=1 Tax=Dothidotthia symphoricarpi CBS 119687 TaxID=1392245 RepID=A0A6A5ZVK9_9PLEO|nr:uncharacterized protein P153DRAFT_391346 [Dothidotthia symphoricarpi CBS 119687]KAF2123620.1 hypothetical protein P153DRAFT_391346 [Dothidotthia symphoricarpi CBS 119687]
MIRNRRPNAIDTRAGSREPSPLLEPATPAHTFFGYQVSKGAFGRYVKLAVCAIALISISVVVTRSELGQDMTADVFNYMLPFNYTGAKVMTDLWVVDTAPISLDLTALEQSRNDSLVAISNITNLLHDPLWSTINDTLGSSVLYQHTLVLNATKAIEEKVSSFDTLRVGKLTRARKDYCYGTHSLIAKQSITIRRIWVKGEQNKRYKESVCSLFNEHYRLLSSMRHIHMDLYKDAWTTWNMARQMVAHMEHLFHSKLYCATNVPVGVSPDMTKCPEIDQVTFYELASHYVNDEVASAIENLHDQLKELTELLEESVEYLHQATASYIARFKLLRLHEVRNLRRWQCEGWDVIEREDHAIINEMNANIGKEVSDMQAEYRNASWLVGNDLTEVEKKLRDANFVVVFLEKLINAALSDGCE